MLPLYMWVWVRVYFLLFVVALYVKRKQNKVEKGKSKKGSRRGRADQDRIDSG